MRAPIVTGGLLAATVAVLVLLNAALELKLEHLVLAGVLTGAVVALVPDRSIAARLGGFAAGVLAAWIGFLLRAGMLPDSDGGLAVSFAVTAVLCVVVVLLARGRVALWAVLLGAGAFAGVYETTFAGAPPEVVRTSVDAVTALAITVVVGFLVASAAPTTRRPAGTPTANRTLEEIAQ